VAAAWLLSVTDVARLFLYRYLIAPAAAAPLVAGLLCAIGPTPRWRTTAAAATIAAALCYVAPNYLAQFSLDRRFIADRDEDWRSATAYIRRQNDRRPVLLYAGLIETASYAKSPDPLYREYCVLPVNGIYRLDERRLVFPIDSLKARRLAPETCQAVTNQRGGWLLLRVPDPDADAAIRRAAHLAASCGRRVRVIEEQSFGGVTAARFEWDR
jgi:hypothetical protein